MIIFPIFKDLSWESYSFAEILAIIWTERHWNGINFQQNLTVASSTCKYIYFTNKANCAYCTKWTDDQILEQAICEAYFSSWIIGSNYFLQSVLWKIIPIYVSKVNYNFFYFVLTLVTLSKTKVIIRNIVIIKHFTVI